jgi:hypothetical protein
MDTYSMWIGSSGKKQEPPHASSPMSNNGQSTHTASSLVTENQSAFKTLMAPLAPSLQIPGTSLFGKRKSVDDGTKELSATPPANTNMSATNATVTHIDQRTANKIPLEQWKQPRWTQGFSLDL